MRKILFIPILLICLPFAADAQTPKFRVIAFYTAKNDLAHISFVHEANRWFPQAAAHYGFSYDSTHDWKNMNPAFISQYQVVLFLDSRPDDSAQRAAFEKYMKAGGGWIGFHFAAFALTPSDYPQNWDWYHDEFIGAGQYKSNTWHPTSAILRVEDSSHPITRGLPRLFKSAPNEWYRWEKDSSSFPLGNGPKPSEIWHSGYYPVAWTNIHYRMVYFNIGHNDIDYDHHTNKELSFQFDNLYMRKLVLNALFWAAGQKTKD
jgi:hypothetical protein